ncbi:MAG: hypothetical protein HQ555_11775 [Candidatus Aminicenantes bacterium]|nr:hypothetical protein [Candidatus Aminicenantes bacterium]
MEPKIKQISFISLLMINIVVIVFLFACGSKLDYEYSIEEGKTKEGISYKTYNFKGKLPPISAEGTLSFLNRYQVDRILRYLELPETDDSFLRKKEDDKFYYEEYSLGTLIFNVQYDDDETKFSPKFVKSITIIKNK